MPTPSIQTLVTDAQQVLNLDSISAVRSVVAVALANANTGTPLNPNLTTQQLWNEFYQVVTKPKSDIESIIANQLMKFLFAPPAPGGVGANKQVIFNDGGVLAGDPQFLWDKTTNLLTVTGSATITGDLTVDTNTLKVDSANNRVGIQITSPTAPLEVGETSGTALRLRRLTSGNTIDVNFYNTNTTVGDVAGIRCDGDGLANTFGAISFWTTQTPNSLVERYRISSVGVHTWQNVGGVAGTAMTLNSTGLGVGGSPASKLTVSDAAAYPIRVVATAGTTAGIEFQDPTTGATRPNIASRGAALTIETGGSERFRIDSSGNVGIGVTPSAWVTFKALELGELGGAIAAGGNNTAVLYNAYFNSGFKYARSGNASSYYQQTLGAHAWYNAPSGTAGNAITFTQAMTLDASGNLLVGTTTNGGNGVSIRPSTASPNVVLVGSDTSGGTAWQLYSTGTSSNRFYVTWAGVVNAVNTTISGISDARLKENVQDIDVGLGAILALKPRKFDWKAGKGKDIKGDRGFIAQEFEQVFPQLVDEWADPAPEGEAPYKSVRQDLIPVLVKAIQELAAEVNALKNA